METEQLTEDPGARGEQDDPLLAELEAVAAPVEEIDAPEATPTEVTALLCSDDTGNHRLLAHLVARSGRGNRVLYCGNAMDHHGYERQGARELLMSQHLDGPGLEPVRLDLRDLTADGVARELASAAAVMFCGGNAYWLAHLLGRGAGEPLRAEASRGLVVAGESSGAVALGASLVPVRAMDNPDIAPGTPRALELVPFAVWPHFGNLAFTGPGADAQRRIQATHPLVQLPDGRGLLVRDGRAFLVDVQLPLAF